jgi:TolB-like protein/DNA-binding winged helix-turn-helix (wHTH) protein
MSTDPPPAVFRFRDFELDLAAYQLRHNGRPVRLERRPMELLVLLVSRHGQLVTREDIVERLWSGKVVIEFDAALNTLVSKARQALHDPAVAPACIETVPGKGYRFIAPIEHTAPGPAAPHTLVSRRKLFLAAVSVLLAMLAAAFFLVRNREVPSPAATAQVAAELKSIAVLPFTDLSLERDQQYFCDGLSEEIIQLLSQSRRMRVIARTSSFAFRGPQADVAEIAKRMNVTHLLKGSVRRSGQHLRITAQLIDTATAAHIWSQSYDREIEDLFKVQSDIAASVARELQLVFPAGVTSRPVQNATAYEHFLRAQFLYQRRNPGDLERAMQHYRRAIEADESFARAWAGLAGAYWRMTREGLLARETGLENMRQASERALALDASLPEAYLRLANYYWINEDYSTGDEYRRKASTLDPDNPLLLSFSAAEALREHRFEQALAIYHAIVASDPLAAQHRYDLASAYYYAGRLVEASNEMAVVLELNPGANADVLALVLILEGKFDPALDLVRQWPESMARAQCLALIHHAHGRRGASDDALAHLAKIAGDSDPGRIAEVHAYRGEIDAAFERLQRATEKPAGDRFVSRPIWIYQLSPFLKPLRDDARWHPWVAAANAASPR